MLGPEGGSGATILIKVLGKGFIFERRLEKKNGYQYALWISRERILQAEGTASAKALRQGWTWNVQQEQGRQAAKAKRTRGTEEQAKSHLIEMAGRPL